MDRWDDVAALRASDPGDMLRIVAGLPRQCREGYDLGRGAEGLPAADGVNSVAFCGMGGSGVAGDVLRGLYRARLRLPVDVVKGPELPGFCGPGTLVVVCSYSGDTSETLACFQEALARGSRVLAVTSGGELLRRVGKLGLGAVLVPGGLQPRAAFGFLALGTLGALERVGLLPRLAADVDEAVRVLEGQVRRVTPDAPASGNAAKAIAATIGDRVPVIWGAEGLGAVAARRWKAQMNENAKVPAFASVLPELDHNEVVGWSPGQGERFALVTLRHPDEGAEIAARFAPSVAIATAAGATHEEVVAEGASGLARLLSLVLVGDFTSVYLALARGVDPTPVEAIDRLKAVLAES